jgi:hypothetical protein
MKGTDVTPEQLAHAEAFLLDRMPPGKALSSLKTIRPSDLIRLLAWYGAIRAKSGNVQPGRLVSAASEMSAAALESGAAQEFIPAPDKTGQRKPEIAPALSALNALHREDIVRLFAILHAILANEFDCLGPESAAVLEDIERRWGLQPYSAEGVEDE